MVTLSPLVELGLIVIGLTSGAIAVAVLMVYLICKRNLFRRQKPKSEMEGDGVQKISDMVSKECLQEPQADVSQTASGDTEETTTESPPRSEKPAASKRKSCLAPNAKKKTRDQQRQVTFGLFPVMVRFQSSHQNSLMDDIVEEEEEEGEGDDTDDENSILQQSCPANRKHNNLKGGECDQEAIRNAAELAAAWKLKAWTKEYDSLQASMEPPPRPQQQANMCSPVQPGDFLCLPTTSCMSEPPTTSIMEEV